VIFFLELLSHAGFWHKVSPAAILQLSIRMEMEYRIQHTD